MLPICWRPGAQLWQSDDPPAQLRRHERPAAGVDQRATAWQPDRREQYLGFPVQPGLAAETLASMGLTVSDAIRVFLTRVVADKELPFALKAANASSRVAIVEANEIIKSRRARFATAASRK
jgi:addiction module RelB/DinJ family antitoxin